MSSTFNTALHIVVTKDKTTDKIVKHIYITEGKKRN